MRKHVVFVCTGNTCRSPMAEVLMRRLLEERGADQAVTVASAGLAAADGASAASAARRVMADRGLDLDSHRSRTVDGELMEKADLVLAMTVSHRDSLKARFPERAHVIYTLKEYAGVTRGSPDVEDPFGQDEGRYRTTAHELADLLERVVQRWSAAGWIGSARTDEWRNQDDAGSPRE